MQLMFLSKLDKKQIIDLINYVNMRSDKNYREVVDVHIYNEPERRDEFNNEQIYVETMSKYGYINAYLIQDFIMTTAFDGSKSKHYDAYLREYLTRVFGDAYLESLKLYYAYLLKQEISRLKGTVIQEQASYFKKA